MGQDFANDIETALIADLVDVAAALDGDVELKVVVGPVAPSVTEDAAFAATVAAAEDNGLKLARRDEPSDPANDSGAGSLEVPLQRVVAIAREPLPPRSLGAGRGRCGEGRGW